MHNRAHEDEGDSDTDSYLQRLMISLPSDRASYGHTGETRSPWPSESDVGVSTHRSVVHSARSNNMSRNGRDDELCECALVTMLSLSHWQGLAAHGRPVQIATSALCSIPSRHLGQNGLSGLAAVNTCVSAAIVQTNTSVAANCEPRLYVMSYCTRLGRTHHHPFAVIDTETKGCV